MARISKRINATIRDEIIDSLLAKKFAKDRLAIERLKEEGEKLAKKTDALAYEACFSPAQIKRLNDAPDGWFPTTERASLRIEKSEGNYHDVRVEFGEKKRVPAKNHPHQGGAFCAVIDADHSYVKHYEAWRDKCKELADARKALDEAEHAAEQKALTIINSVTTVDKLVEIWPPIKDYLPENVSGENGGLPAEMIDEISKEFGL
jgi:hypothetical protein